MYANWWYGLTDEHIKTLKENRIAYGLLPEVLQTYFKEIYPDHIQVYLWNGSWAPIKSATYFNLASVYRLCPGFKIPEQDTPQDALDELKRADTALKKLLTKIRSL